MAETKSGWRREVADFRDLFSDAPIMGVLLVLVLSGCAVLFLAMIVALAWMTLQGVGLLWFVVGLVAFGAASRRIYRWLTS